MSLLQRKPRPLTRDTDSLRNDRLFIIACDDTYAPKQYFDFFRIPRVKIHVVPTPDGTSAAQHVLGRILQFDHEPGDELWMVLNTDHCTAGTHLTSFLQAVNEARRQGVNVALSKPCFELWLLLHHLDAAAVTGLADAHAVIQALRTTLGQYNKTQLRKSDYPLTFVIEACQRAKRLDSVVGGGELPAGNTSRIYLLWKAIVAKALPTQLPAELRVLLPVGAAAGNESRTLSS